MVSAIERFHCIDRVHPVQISSQSDYCITTDMMWRYTKIDEKENSLKNRSVVLTIKSEQDSSWICAFCKALDNVEPIMNMKFKKFSITVCRDMDKKTLKIPPKWGFSPICDPQDFFSKIGLCHFCTLMVP